MSLEEFKKAAPHAMLRNAQACKVLKVTGKSASKIAVHELGGGGPGITTVKDLATEYFYKVGPNVRRLTDLVGKKTADSTFAESMLFWCTCFHRRSHRDRDRAQPSEGEVEESDN